MLQNLHSQIHCLAKDQLAQFKVSNQTKIKSRSYVLIQNQDNLNKINKVFRPMENNMTFAIIVNNSKILIY